MKMNELPSSSNRNASCKRAKGHFTRECGCTSHAIFTTGKYNLRTVWLLARQPYQEFQKRGLVSNFKKSLCTGCTHHAGKYFASHRTLPSTGSRNGREEHSLFSTSTSNQEFSVSQFDYSTFEDLVLSEIIEMVMVMLMMMGFQVPVSKWSADLQYNRVSSISPGPWHMGYHVW